MIIAYLINEYPKVSHSFIRREIAALEADGLEVVRCSIRPPRAELVDEADRAEARRTRVVLGAGVGGCVAATAGMALGRTARFLRTTRAAAALARRSSGPALPVLLRHMAYLVEACVLARWLKQTRVNHLHAHFGTNPAAVALLVHLLTDLPYSFTVHGPEEFDRPEALALTRKIEHARFVIAVSSFGRSQLYRWCGHEQWRKIHVIHCGLDARFLHRAPRPDLSEADGGASEGPDAAGPAPLAPARVSGPALPRFVCVGRLCEQKGQLLLIEAAQRLAREGRRFELVLVGDGEMRPQVEKLIRRCELENVARITGWQSGEEVTRHLRGARAMVLPSFAEGLPVAIMEAMALGTPVISTWIAGIPELVTPACGWLVPAGGVDALADAMRGALAASPRTLAATGAAGARRVGERHDASIEAAKLAALFENAPASGAREVRESPGELSEDEQPENRAATGARTPREPNHSP